MPKRAMSTTNIAQSVSSDVYTDEMYLQWRANPSSVHASWAAYFSSGSYSPKPNLVPYAQAVER